MNEKLKGFLNEELEKEERRKARVAEERIRDACRHATSAFGFDAASEIEWYTDPDTPTMPQADLTECAILYMNRGSFVLHVYRKCMATTVEVSSLLGLAQALSVECVCEVDES